MLCCIVTFGCVNNARQSLAWLLNYSAREWIARYKVPAQDGATTDTDRHRKERACTASNTMHHLQSVPCQSFGVTQCLCGTWHRDKWFVIRRPLMLSADVSVKLWGWITFLSSDLYQIGPSVCCLSICIFITHERTLGRPLVLQCEVKESGFCRSTEREWPFSEGVSLP